MTWHPVSPTSLLSPGSNFPSQGDDSAQLILCHRYHTEKKKINKRTFRPAASPWEKNIYFYLFAMWSHRIFMKLHSGKNSFLPAMTNALSVSRRITIKWVGHVELKLCGGKQKALNYICFKYLGMIYCGTLLNACMLEYDPMNLLHLQTWNGSYQCGTMCRLSRLKSLLFLYFLSFFFLTCNSNISCWFCL